MKRLTKKSRRFLSSVSTIVLSISLGASVAVANPAPESTNLLEAVTTHITNQNSTINQFLNSLQRTPTPTASPETTQNTSLTGQGPSQSFCGPDRPLVTSLARPHNLGDDMAAIDYYLGGDGDMNVIMDRYTDNQGEAMTFYAMGFARAATLLNLVSENIGLLSEFESMLLAPMTEEEEWKLNAAMRVQLMLLNAEITSLESFLLTNNVSPTLGNSSVFTAQIIQPHDSEFQVNNNTSVNAEIERIRINMDEHTEANASYASARSQAVQHATNHRSLGNRNAMQAAAQQLSGTIQDHDDHKQAQHILENYIRGLLDTLYEDGELAWDRMRPQLQNSSGTPNMANNGWQAALGAANSISTEAMRRVPTTAYGNRRIVGYDIESNEPIYSTIPMTPVSYPAVSHLTEFAVTAIQVTATGPDDGPGEELNMSHALQAYMELTRRERSLGRQRRGTAPERGMTQVVWNEFLDNAIVCLDGPFDSEASHILRRPETFDAAKTCEHLVWAGGEAEDFISEQNFRGWDRTLWGMKLDMARIMLITNGAEGHFQAIQETITEIETITIPRYQALNNDQMVDHLRDVVAMLQSMLEDTNFETDPRVPPQP